MLANYHTHTWRCKHADPDERTYIEAAIANSMKVLGFSEHAPYPGVQPWMRMDEEQTAEYFDTIHRLRDEYAGRIEIHAGVEAEYYPAYFPALLDLLRQNGCEYILLGQHYIYNGSDDIYNALATEDDTRLIRYVEEVIEGMETGYFTYVAHPDILNYTGSDKDLYRAQMRLLCRTAKRLDIPLELNLVGLRKGRNYPERRFWEIAAEENCRALIGCDAHHPQYLNDPEREAAAHRFLKELGITPEDTVSLVPIA